ncbi:MAG: DUF1841 family protein [Betaproteobacteria bacterium]|nr:DUF1841 family protein [Betaproteobacteria bacterium]
MFQPSRDQARDFWFEAWGKYRAQQPLSPLESMAVEIVGRHPEYQDLLADRDAYLEKHRDRDYPPEFGETNPFLHMGMHLSIREQVSIDQPVGVRDAHRRLSEKLGNTLDAEHQMMDCLAEMIWSAQRQRSAPDATLYLKCLQRKTGA